MDFQLRYSVHENICNLIIAFKVHGNICYYYQSFVGRDFKAWMQMAIFVLKPYLTVEAKKMLVIAFKGILNKIII